MHWIHNTHYQYVLALRLETNAIDALVQQLQTEMRLD